MRIWVDNKQVVDRWRKGPTWCCVSCRPAADLWCHLWKKLDDIGTDGIKVLKCKGHTADGGTFRPVV